MCLIVNALARFDATWGTILPGGTQKRGLVTASRRGHVPGVLR
jgi:hypothetical protein